VRELRNVVQRAYVMAAGPVIDTAWLPAVEAGASAASAASAASTETAWAAPPPAPAGAAAAAAAPAALPAAAPGVPSITLPIGTSMAEAERALILATLQHFHHHKERTAATLGVSLKTLYNRLKEYAAGGDNVGEATGAP
jgi:two-component system, NtrC family, response regulator AtoC